MGLLDKISKKKTASDKEVKDSAPKADDKVKRPAAKKAEAKKTDKKIEAGSAKADKKDDKKTDNKKDAAAKKVTASLFAYEIIREPVLTEKGDRGQMQSKYTFYVSRGANKVEIARAIQELYGVKPISVRVLNLKGKAVRFGRLRGIRKSRRKAVVTLKQGDTISVTE